MNPKHLIKALVCLLSLFFFSGPAFAAAGPHLSGSQTIPLSTTPTQLACSGQRWVNKLTVRVVPGFEGKVFVGISGMNTSTYANTLAVLYPNGGAHSEEYVIQDPNNNGDDGIDLCSIYVAGGIGGEKAVAEYESTDLYGTLEPIYYLQPFFVEAVTNSNLTSLLPAGTNYYSVLRVQVIPGNTGKQTISTAGTKSGPFQPTFGEAAVLYPNTGNIAQHNAWSESWSIYDPYGMNNLILGTVPQTSGVGIADFQITPQVTGEAVLVSIWRKLAAPTYGSTVETATNPFTVNSQRVSTSTTATAAFPALTGSNQQVISPRIRQIPGFGSKTYITDCLTHAIRTLYPNTTGSLGFSEEFNYEVSALSVTDAGSNKKICLTADSTAAADVSYLQSYDAAVYNDDIPGVAPMTQAAGSLTPTSGGLSSIGRGDVSHLLISVTPGQSGKMYIGSSTMNTYTLAGVYAILYPNHAGRWSEAFELDDARGNGIHSNDIYVAAAVNGESVIVSTTTSLQADDFGDYAVVASGALSGSYSSYAVPFTAASTSAFIIRAQAIPGGSGKLWIGNSAMTAAQPDSNYANVLKVLWPSQGNYNVGEGFSETFKQSCVDSGRPAAQADCFDLHNFTFWPYFPGEQLLVFAIARQ